MKIAAYPLAAVSGYYATSVSVHNSAYNTAKMLGAFDDILEKATPVSKEGIKDRVQGVIGKEEFLKRAYTIKSAYQDAADERLEHLGINSFWKKWRYMAKAAKQSAIIDGLTVSGIAVGALLTIANSKSIADLLSDKKESGEKSL